MTTELLEMPAPPKQKRRTLFAIGDDLMALDNLLLEREGDITDCAEVIDEWLNEIQSDLENKVDGYCLLINEHDARGKILSAESKRMRDEAQVEENLCKSLKERLKFFFEGHGTDKLTTAHYKLWIQNNGGKTPVAISESFDVALLPERFQKVTVEPDTDAIRAALEAGEVLEFATLGERGTHLRIK